MAYTVEMGGIKYPFDENGAVEWLDFAHRGLGLRGDSSTLYIRGFAEQGYPPLGAGLQIESEDRSEPYGTTIWPDDIPTFLDRYKAFKLKEVGFVDGEDGRKRPLNEAENNWCTEVLSHPDLDQEAIGLALEVSSRQSLGATLSRLVYAVENGLLPWST